MTNKISPDCSSVTDKLESGEQLSHKRKSKEGLTVDSPPSQDIGDKMKGKRQKKGYGGTKKIEDKNKKEEKTDKKKGSDQEAPTGYIHVRARRGQATDNHSLAERVRREKISERMRMLQALVPGCDKVIGKALMLDQIINYVQSLQNQVEFLSMKLASLNPMLYDFGMDLDSSFMARPDQTLSSLEIPPVQSMQQPDQVQPSIFCDNNSVLANSNNSCQMDASAFLLFQQSQISQLLTQGKGQILWDVDDQRHIFGNQQGFTNNSLFH